MKYRQQLINKHRFQHSMFFVSRVSPKMYPLFSCVREQCLHISKHHLCDSKKPEKIINNNKNSLSV